MDFQTYQSAGVDVHKAESFVGRLKRLARRPEHDALWPAAGGYAAVYPVSEHQAVALTTDGVGTKLLVACELRRHDTIGIDLVAMCANDLICVGARPDVFLDYYATGKLEDDQSDALIAGIIAGCDQAGMILAGGETAEMPDLYQSEHYDIAGFALGQLSRSRLITGDSIKAGDWVIGVASSGIHSNGLSLARKVLPRGSSTYEQLLIPTLIYVRPVNELLAAEHRFIRGIAHITGGGWRNLFRLNPGAGYFIDNPLPVPPVLEQISSAVSEEEMYKTFNMGMGLCLIVEPNDRAVIETFRSHGFAAERVGYVTDDALTLTIKDSSVVIKG